MAHADLVDPITNEIVRKAVMGVDIIDDLELLHKTYSGQVPEECRIAICLIRDNPANFDNWVHNRLSALPLTNLVFGELIRARTKQTSILTCPILHSLYDDAPHLERILERIQYRLLSKIETLRSDYNPSDNRKDTDSTILNLYAEILVLDLMVELGFEKIVKIEKQEFAHIDFIGQRHGRSYAVEVTRKKEIEDWKLLDDEGLEGNWEDCSAPENQKRIRKLLKRALKDKNRQFSDSLRAGTLDGSVVKVVGIRTADVGFTECIAQAEQIARGLLQKTNVYQYIDCVWLVPQSEIGQSRWICRNMANIVRSGNA